MMVGRHVGTMANFIAMYCDWVNVIRWEMCGFRLHSELWPRNCLNANTEGRPLESSLLIDHRVTAFAEARVSMKMVPGPCWKHWDYGFDIRLQLHLNSLRSGQPGSYLAQFRLQFWISAGRLSKLPYNSIHLAIRR